MVADQETWFWTDVPFAFKAWGPAGEGAFSCWGRARVWLGGERAGVRGEEESGLPTW
jgi:hypothetical protein